MGFMGIFNSIENVIQSIGDEINVDQGILDDVKRQLHESQAGLEGIRFDDLRLPESAFGGNDSGNQLGGHHTAAHQVISETLHGLLADLTRFRDGIVHAEKFLDEADNTSAADLASKKQAVDALVSATSHSDADRANHEARNHYLGNGGAHR